MKIKNKKIIWMFLVLIMTPFAAWGAPTITDINGTFGNGQGVIIYGSGFGSKTQALPQFWDTVENQSAYQVLSDGDTIPVGGINPWLLNQGGVFKMESTDIQRSIFSSKSYKGTGTEIKLGDKTVTNSGKLYLAWWFKPSISPNTSTAGGHSSKFVRLSNSNDPVNKTFSWTQANNYVYRTDEGYCQQSGGTYLNNWSGNANQWNFQEVFIDGINRVYQIAINGSTFQSGVWNLCSAFDFDEVLGLGWDSGGTTPLSMTVWMDDIYLDNTPQRVMLCTGSSWATRNNCEVQISSAWQNNRIDFNFNQGYFALSQQAYLYVIDNVGAVNTVGYPIVIGETASGTGPSLSSPTGLSVL